MPYNTCISNSIVLVFYINLVIVKYTIDYILRNNFAMLNFLYMCILTCCVIAYNECTDISIFLVLNLFYFISGKLAYDNEMVIYIKLKWIFIC